MPKPTLKAAIAALTLTGAITPASGGIVHQQEQKAEIGFVEVGQDITLRRMVVRNPSPKGTVLFLHGFPETLYAWQEVAGPLANDYEVHAFDWPGYGLSSRPPAGRFSYAPRDYARILEGYIRKAGIDRSKLVIYATDIGALPALLLALEQPDVAKRIIVGDFAPFDRPQHMYGSLQSLKSPASSEQIRMFMKLNRDEILANTFKRGLSAEEQFETSSAFKEDVSRGWGDGDLTSADAFYHYYSGFTRDQDYFEANIARLKTPVNVIWGEKDLYINKAMGEELARRIRAELILLPGTGHYPHLQDPTRTVEEVRAAFRSVRGS